MAYKFFSESALAQLISKIKGIADTKVDKVTGKTLTANDFTDDLKAKLDGIDEGANKYELPTADANTLGGVKIGDGLNMIAGVLNANGKVDKVEGKGLSTEDFTTEEKTKLANLVTGVSSVNGKDGAVTLTAGDVGAYTKEEVDAKTSRVYRYAGSLPTYEDVLAITNPNDGDTYNVLDTGMNYAWVEDENRWDPLGSIFDASGLVAKTDMVEITAADVNAEWTKVFTPAV